MKISGLWLLDVPMFLNLGFLPVSVLVAQQVLPDSSPLPLLTHFLPQLLLLLPRNHILSQNGSALPNNRSDDSAEQLLLHCCTAAGHWTPLNRQQSLVSPLHLTLTCFNHPKNHCSPPTLTPLRLKNCFLSLLPGETRNSENYVVRRFLAAAATRHHCCGAGATVGGAAEQPVVGKVRMRNAAYLSIDVTQKPNKCNQCK